MQPRTGTGLPQYRAASSSTPVLCGSLPSGRRRAVNDPGDENGSDRASRRRRRRGRLLSATRFALPMGAAGDRIQPDPVTEARTAPGGARATARVESGSSPRSNFASSPSPGPYAGMEAARVGLKAPRPWAWKINRVCPPPLGLSPSRLVVFAWLRVLDPLLDACGPQRHLSIPAERVLVPTTLPRPSRGQKSTGRQIPISPPVSRVDETDLKETCPCPSPKAAAFPGSRRATTCLRIAKPAAA